MSRGGVVFAVVLAAAAAAGLWFLVGGGDRARAPDAATEEGATDPAAETQVPGLLGSRKASVESPAGTPLKVKGSVTDAKGLPAPDVRVTARRTGPVWDASDPKSWGVTGPKESFARTLEGLDSPGKADPEPDGEAKSAADGTFEMTFRQPGNYEVTARPEVPKAGTRAYAALTAAKPEATVKVQVLDGSAFRGKVVDAADRPLAAAVRVSMTSDSGMQTSYSPPPVFTEASTGEFALEGVPAGKLTLGVTLPGRMSLSGIEATAPYDGVFVIRIPAGGVLRGSVSNAEGRPIAGADVVANVKPVGEATWSSARAKSASDGTWRMEGVVAGNVTMLSVLAAGYTFLQQSPPRAPWSGAQVKVGEETRIDVVLKRGGMVAGRVTEAGTGAGIPEVQIELALAEAVRTWYGPGATVVTDAEGRYRFDDVALGKYVLLPQSATHWFAPVEAAFSASTAQIYDPTGATPNPTPPALTVVLTKEGEAAERNLEGRKGLPLRGRVVGPDGQPVEGATVSSTTGGFGNVAYRWGVQAYGNTAALATSGPDGTFTIPGLAPRESWTLAASKEGFVGVPSDPVRVAADAPVPEVTLRLIAGASISGRVVDSEGKGLPSWTLWFWSTEGGGGVIRSTSQTTTDGEGKFTLRSLAAGKGQLNASGPGGSSTQMLIDTPLAVGEKREGVEIRIEAGVDVSGVLVDAEGKPVGGQGVSAVPASGGVRLSNAWATTKADGTFVLKGLARGKVNVSVNVMGDAGYGENVVIGEALDAPASNVRLVWTPRKKTTIRARVTDDQGRPIPLAIVSIEGRTRQVYYAQGSPDEVVNGEMTRTVDGTPPFTLAASAPRDEWGRPLNLKSRKVVVSDPTVTTVIVMEPGLEIVGTVVGPDGRGVPAATVTGGGTQTQTDEDGRFRLLGLATDAEIDVTVRPPQRFVPPPNARAKPGVSDLVIRLAVGASISGRVIGPDGNPATNANVSASWRSPSSGRQGNTYATVQSGGTFRLEGLPDDAVATLTARSWSPTGGETLRATQVENVRAGRDDLVIRLEFGVAIEGRVVYSDGRPAAFSWIQVARADRPTPVMTSGMPTDATTGAFRVPGLEPGPYNLTVMSQRGMPMGEATRVDAPAREVRIVVAAPARLSGRLEGAAAGQEYWVSAWPSDADVEAPGRASAKVGPDGTFALDVPAGKDLTVAVMYGPDDRYALEGPVKAGTAEVVLRLVPGAAIEGVLEDAAGAPKVGAWVYARNAQWRATAKTEGQGRFRFKGLPPGKFTLTFRQEATTIPLGEAEAGATGLRLRLPP